MANATISQIKVGNTTYDICDAVSRNFNEQSKIKIYSRSNTFSVSIAHNSWGIIAKYVPSNNIINNITHILFFDTMFSWSANSNGRRANLISQNENSQGGINFPSTVFATNIDTTIFNQVTYWSDSQNALYFKGYQSTTKGTSLTAGVAIKLTSFEWPTSNIDYPSDISEIGTLESN